MTVTRIAPLSLFVLAAGCGGQSSPASTATPSSEAEPVSNTVAHAPSNNANADILPPGERTEGMIATDIWQAIADNDVDLAAAYAPSVQTVREVCPAMWENPKARAELERELGDMRPSLSEQFAHCRELLDFAAVEPPEPEWDRNTDSDDCAGVAVMTNARIGLDTGRGLLELTIQIVTLRDGRVYLADVPRCWLDEGE